MHAFASSRGIRLQGNLLFLTVLVFIMLRDFSEVKRPTFGHEVYIVFAI